ncbi:HAMP domain-containing sensor histidine kinase [Halorubellus sp. PRR65]|uniref:sensor histidine kinase n=1 Tax=Halorubellus sp. PRR65 TaxID=3098148 RepID=UPI002B25662C|nr:HAMP domain-containing sensor histidine kinase [Halorubellus sp. PRR65]
MARTAGSEDSRRLWPGLSVSAIGLVLLGVPAYDIWDDVTALSWHPTTTLLENLTFVVLAGVLVAGGVWLTRVDWAPRHSRTVAVRTLAGTAVVLSLVAFVVVVQDTVMGSLKPYVIAMDAVLIGATTSFGLGVYSARAQRNAVELSRSARLNEHLETLLGHTSDLEAAQDRERAFEVVSDAIDALLGERAVEVVVDGDVVVAPAGVDADATPTVRAAVDDRGHVAVYDDAVPGHERETMRLLAVHLAGALARLDREAAMYKQRERLEFVNRTVRHNLLNDVNVVSSRLSLLEPRPQDREHVSTVVDRVDGMASFIQTMRQYTDTIADDGPEPSPVPLEPTLREQVEAVRAGYPDAEVVLEPVPDVAVLADELFGPVLENPLTNAIEHHDGDRPRVEVAATVDGDAVIVTFADDGPGIADDRKDRVFERGETAGMTAGTGFGLYLVKDVVESYGGSVDVRDNDPRGTVVELALPLAADDDGGDGDVDGRSVDA